VVVLVTSSCLDGVSHGHYVADDLALVSRQARDDAPFHTAVIPQTRRCGTVKKLIVLGTGAVGTAAAAMALFGMGIAAADDYAGKTYADASSAASDASQTVVIATRFGDRLADDDCIVTSSEPAPFIHGDDFAHVTDTVQFNLNCSGAYASATSPGDSVASPTGREAKSTVEDAAAATGETSPGGVPTIDGVPCTGRNIGKCMGLAQSGG
jgi:hypothetical protein